MYGRKRSPLMGAFLRFLSVIYGAAMRIRSFAYAAGILNAKKLPCMVVSIGNITLGGTGKTPLVISLADLMLREGRRPVILSRGYGRSNPSSLLVVSDGAGREAPPAIAGDEPAFMAARLPRVPVVVCSDRYRAGMLAWERFAPDVAILDDGFQHLRLARNLDILLIDAADPFGNGRLFPSGILREPLTALGRADAVIVTRAEQARDPGKLTRDIKRYTAAPVFTARYRAQDLRNVLTGERKSLSAIRGLRIFAFSGIARPDSLVSLLQEQGALVAGNSGFPDHHAYTSSDIAALSQRAADAAAALLVTTEKDGVKLRGMAAGSIWALCVSLEIAEQQEWEALVMDFMASHKGNRR